MTDFKAWSNHEKLEFQNQHFGDIDLTFIKAKPNPDNFDFNTELIFENCRIKSFNAPTLCLGRPIIFKNCKIERLSCFSTYFFGGLKMTNCTIAKPSTFDCGVHNINPNEFIIDNCTFFGHLDFFDVYFGGPVIITNNDFRQGTSIALYLNDSLGIEENLSFIIKNNKGKLDKYADNDPFKPEN